MLLVHLFIKLSEENRAIFKMILNYKILIDLVVKISPLKELVMPKFLLLKKPDN